VLMQMPMLAVVRCGSRPQEGDGGGRVGMVKEH
jgi:hypothetical protein